MSASRERILITYTTFALSIFGVLASPAVKHNHTQLPGLLVLAALSLMYAFGARAGWLERFYDRYLDNFTDTSLSHLTIPQLATAITLLFAVPGVFVILTGGIGSPYFFLFFYPLIMLALRFGTKVSLGASFVLSAVYLLFGRTVVAVPGFRDASAISFPMMALFGSAANLRLRRSARLISHRIRELDTLVDISRMLETAIDLRTTLNLILINAPETIRFSNCAIYLMDEDGTMKLSDYVPRSGKSTLVTSIVVDPGLRDRREQFEDRPFAFTRQQAISSGDLILGPNRAVLFDSAASSVVYAPLRGAEGLIGLLCFSRAVSQAVFAARDIDTIGRYATHVGLSVQQALYRDRLERLAFNDTMTGLANYRYFEKRLAEELSRCERYGHALTVIMLDIDHFKKFNDSYGHKAGDALLAQVGIVIKNTLRETDIPARYGGEEFVIVCPETAGERALQISERIRSAIESAMFMLPHGTQGGEYKASVTVSVGSATFPADARGGETLVALADEALYVAKESGRNRSVAAGNVAKRD